ncbi:MAG: hypothetical protein SOY30_14965 [Eubacteriales bacterium]|nr:hypothetical protein [Eubacteriales bacterium]
MKFVLCPRCELNYITETEKYCKVCLREMKGDAPRDEIELCSVCNEAPALPGRDVCLFCLKEMSGQDNRDDDTEQEHVDTASIGGMDSVSTMDEIIPEIDEDIPSQEYGEIENELSLESVREDEENEQDDDEDEDNR